ncbi:MAG: GH3 auxin-responsive promoter family protein [Planctomycetes bacterium]|nr:GH3 auxin-responsive promoter family protein [Planctomycetota bacterium]
MSALRNDAVRHSLRLGLGLAPTLVQRSLRARIGSFVHDQRLLRAELRIQTDTPILPWGPLVEQRVEAWAARHPGTVFAYTSGTTSRPKKIAFNRERLSRIKRGSWEAAVQAGAVHGVVEPTLFVLAALKRDASLTTLMLDEGARTPFVEGLIMPSKYLWEAAIAPLLERYGPRACRLWLLLLSNPGFIYSTNPSTLAVFCEGLNAEWEESVALVRAVVSGANLPPIAAYVAGRVVSRGSEERLRRAADAPSLPPLEDLFPGLVCYACWDGGYVAPFLERIRVFLPPERFAHVPMYSMATETVQTQLYYEGRTPHFLPLAPGVLYEFLPEGEDDDPRALLPASALRPGQTYGLVVSDRFGLRRYQTNDLFLCATRVRGLPDLRFLRRRGLAYSFTGEKLTGEQVSASFAALRVEVPRLSETGAQLTLIPSWLERPHYRLALAFPGRWDEGLDPLDLAARLDRLLRAENEEYETKRSSERLGAVRAIPLAYDRLAEALGGGRGGGANEARAWETQFKLVPLYTRTWEAIGLSEGAHVGGHDQ